MNIKSLSVIITLLSIGLSGCNDDNKATKGQVLAKVNNSEITVLQLNTLIAGNDNINNEQKQKILDNLINQELLVQKASELKLDRDPAVLQNIEQTKRQILSQAVIQKLSTKPHEPTVAEISDFYNKNPLLFSERKLFTLKVFLIDAQSLDPETMTKIDSSKSPVDTIHALDSSNLQYKSLESKKYSDNLPLELAIKLNTLKVGDIIKLDENNQVILSQLVETEEKPIDLDSSKDAIIKILSQKYLNSSIENNIQQLRSKAKIEVFEKFSNDSSDKNSSMTADSLKKGIEGIK